MCKLSELLGLKDWRDWQKEDGAKSLELRSDLIIFDTGGIWRDFCFDTGGIWR